MSPSTQDAVGLADIVAVAVVSWDEHHSLAGS